METLPSILIIYISIAATKDFDQKFIRFKDIDSKEITNVIETDGRTPFVIVGVNKFDCVHGVDRNKSLKEKNRNLKKSNEVTEMNYERLKSATLIACALWASGIK